MAVFLFGAGEPFVFAAAVHEPAAEQAARLRSEGKLFEAERTLSRALHREPANAALRFEMANLYALYHDRFQKDGSVQHAEAMLGRVVSELEQAVMLDPDFIPALYNLGVTYKRLGQHERARENLRKVIRLAEEEGNPGVKLNALLQIGATYEEQRFFDEARDYYEEARRLNYFDPAMRGVLDDLEQRRERHRELDLKKTAHERMMTPYRRFSYAPFSHASTQYDERTREMESQGGIAQVIPYLSMMLVQQFLNRQGALQDEFF